MKIFIKDLYLQENEVMVFYDTIFPLVYLEKVKNKSKKKLRDELEPVIVRLKKELDLAAKSMKNVEFLRKKADEIASLFQRSSSCVEGRNGVLSLMHHGHQGITEDRLKALTVIHNFYIEREDKTTAAERFFQRKHTDVFEELLKKVKIPERPRVKWKESRKGAKPKLRGESLIPISIFNQTAGSGTDKEQEGTSHEGLARCEKIDQNGYTTSILDRQELKERAKLQVA